MELKGICWGDYDYDESRLAMEEIQTLRKIIKY